LDISIYEQRKQELAIRRVTEKPYAWDPYYQTFMNGYMKGHSDFKHNSPRQASMGPHLT